MTEFDQDEGWKRGSDEGAHKGGCSDGMQKDPVSGDRICSGGKMAGGRIRSNEGRQCRFGKGALGGS